MPLAPQPGSPLPLKALDRPAKPEAVEQPLEVAAVGSRQEGDDEVGLVPIDRLLVAILVAGGRSYGVCRNEVEARKDAAARAAIVE